MRVGFALLLGFALASLPGCDDKPAAPAAAPVAAPAPAPMPAAAPAAVAAPGPGVVTGVITLAGPAPEMAELQRGADPVCAKDAMKDESVIVGKKGELANVIVHIIGAAGDAAARREGRRCSSGQLHVRARASQARRRRADARDQEQRPVAAQRPHLQGRVARCSTSRRCRARRTSRRRSRENGVLMKFKCDVHQWMTGYVWVQNNPLLRRQRQGRQVRHQGHPRRHLGRRGVARALRHQEGQGHRRRGQAGRDGNSSSTAPRSAEPPMLTVCSRRRCARIALARYTAGLVCFTFLLLLAGAWCTTRARRWRAPIGRSASGRSSPRWRAACSSSTAIGWWPRRWRSGTRAARSALDRARASHAASTARLARRRRLGLRARAHAGACSAGSRSSTALPTLVSTAHLATSQLFFLDAHLHRFRAASPRRAPARGAAEPQVQRMTLWGAGLVYAQMIARRAHAPPRRRARLHRRAAVPGQAVADGRAPERDAPRRAPPVRARRAGHRALGGRGRCAHAAPAARQGAGHRGPFLVVVQMTLGIFSVTTFLDAVPVTAHLGVAALLLADLRLLHLLARGPRARRRPRRHHRSRRTR